MSTKTDANDRATLEVIGRRPGVKRKDAFVNAAAVKRLIDTGLVVPPTTNGKLFLTDAGQAALHPAEVTSPYVADPDNPTDAEFAAAIERGLADGSLIDAEEWLAQEAAKDAAQPGEATVWIKDGVDLLDRENLRLLAREGTRLPGCLCAVPANPSPLCPVCDRATRARFIIWDTGVAHVFRTVSDKEANTGSIGCYRWSPMWGAYATYNIAGGGLGTYDTEAAAYAAIRKNDGKLPEREVDVCRCGDTTHRPGTELGGHFFHI